MPGIEINQFMVQAMVSHSKFFPQNSKFEGEKEKSG
jgi:hypothetical protein